MGKLPPALAKAIKASTKKQTPNAMNPGMPTQPMPAPLPAPPPAPPRPIGNPGSAMGMALAAARAAKMKGK